MNQDLLANPFDAELQSITGPFGTLLRAAVQTIDEHGLVQKFLKRHQPDVDEFFRSIEGRSFRSEAAEALRGRLLRNRDGLFTFIRHDGVGWNNNLAENAVRQFAYYREDTPGMLREEGLKEYLLLLGLHQTCRYRGVSFLKFMLSREMDVDAFCESPGRRQKPPVIEVYPEGHACPDFGRGAAEAGRDELRKLQGQWDLVERAAPDGSVGRFGGEVGLRPPTLTFDGDAVAASPGWPDPPQEFRGRCRLNPRRKPHRVDFQHPDAPTPRNWKGHTTPGIYELDGDVLRICFPAGGNGRPDSFEPGKGNWVYTLRRKPPRPPETAEGSKEG
jgi:uncharacterized protein (TIGR03067 family)